MIRISFLKDSSGNPIAVKCLGHAGYAESGKDIYCAGVSTLVLNTINSIEVFTDDEFTCDVNEKRGYICFSLTTSSEKSLLLMKSLELGVTQIIDDKSSRKYVKLIDWEV